METTTVGLQHETNFPQLAETTLCGAFQVTAREFADRDAIRTKGGDFSITWSEYAQRTERAAAGLAGLGLGRGDTLAIMLTNRPEFHWIDAGAMHLGAIPFSVYNTYSPEQIEYLVSDAKNRIVVTEQAFLDRVRKVKEDCSTVEHIVVVDGEAEGCLSLDDLENSAKDDFDFEAAWKAVEEDDVITLIYTSGTTGPPKGVQITHANEMTALRSFDQIIEFPAGARLVSYLPMAHIAERSCTQYLPMAFGFTITDCPDAREVISYLPEVRPSWFFAVPRIYEKLKAGLEANLENIEDPEQKQKALGALQLGLKKVRLEQAGEEVPEELQQAYAQADEQLFSKLRAGLGLDQLEALNVGAAPTPREVIEFFHAIGLPLAELWGMSETCGAGTCNRPGAIRIGTVGPPSPYCEVTLAEDGEVLVKGGIVMKGYRNQPEKTKETFNEDGWLMTGDIGEFDEAGHLKIVDRKKELIINAAGKNMSPANIEAKLKTAGPLIGQAVAIGDQRPFNTALVTLDPDSVPGWAKANGLEGKSIEELSEDPKVVEAVEAEIEKANESLARVEQIKKFKILPTDWEPGGEELTPTMKLKRKPIAEKYKDEIEALYAK
ncbi:MAG: long-chain fatty acid--CoA ligase [Actinomycetota bacterium]|nr:long-chain fatty acid--CoA ligase [Actinomycetota bacterium]